MEETTRSSIIANPHQLQIYEQSVYQTKQWILNWFALSKEEKRRVNSEAKNTVLYTMLIPILCREINISSLLLSSQELNDQFNRFFYSSFRLKTVRWRHEQIYNLNQVVIMNLDKNVLKNQLTKKSTSPRIDNKFKKVIIKEQKCQPWEKVQYYSNLITLSSTQENQQVNIIVCDKNLLDRFKTDLLKEDYQIKNKFVYFFLFCNVQMPFPIGCISVERIKKGQTIKGTQEKAYLIFSGTVNQQIQNKTINFNLNNSSSIQKNTTSLKKLGQKWCFQLVRGSLICKTNIINLLSDKKNLTQNNQYTHIYTLTSDTVFLTISHNDLLKIIKVDKKVQNLIINKLQVAENTHVQFIKKSLNVQQYFRESEQVQQILYYSIPRNKKSKAFRRRTDIQLNNFEQFVSLNMYEKMTQNKQNVQKRHMEYESIKSHLREEQKQQRMKKKMKTQKGMRQIKKCEYIARLKQNKIQKLAIKDCILDACKFRDRTKDVRFIFDEDIVPNYQIINNNNNNHTKLENKGQLARKYKNKFTSMIEFRQNRCQGLLSKMQLKIDMMDSKPISVINTSRINHSSQILHFQSTPQILQPKMGKMI